jgi:translation initiation factor 3 subunit D
MDWRKKIETQRGAVLATELKNNANKLAKWTCQAMLADVSILKLGYVSRQSPRNNKAHSIVQMQTYKPKDFATQINLSHLNMWGIFKSIVDICRKQEDGKLLLVKDPNKALLRLYELPPEETNAILGKEETAAGGTFEGEAPPGG